MSESYSEAEAREIIRQSVLIEEAAKAMVALAPGERWEDCDREWYLRDARVALAVFEKAHTPTDDERETLTLIVRDVHNFDGRPEHLSLSGAEAGRIADAILAGGFRRSEVSEPSEEHDCEFECGSDEEHLRRAYEALRNEYEGYRQWVRIAFSHNIAEADAKKIASRYVWHMTPSGGGLRNSAKAMQAALSEYIKLRVNAAHAAQGSEGA